MKNLSSHFLRALGRLNFRAWQIFTRCLDVSIRASAWLTVKVLCVAVPLGVLLAIISASSHCYLYFENLALREARAAYVQGVDYLAREHGYVVPVSVRASEPPSIEDMIRRELIVNDLPSGLLPVFRAVIKHESGDRPDAVSKSGAIGLSQCMPANAKFCGLPSPALLFDPEQNIACGVRIFAHALRNQKGNLVRALKEYNGGAGRIDATHENRAYPDKVFMELAKLEIEE